MYESICAKCNPSARGKGNLKEYSPEMPSLYVGESSRSLSERVGEHWEAYRGKKENSHIWKHQLLCHGGEKPDFLFKVVRGYRTALSRQVGEAVRIRRRGGEGGILNSKGEFNRCQITRLTLGEEDVSMADGQTDSQGGESTALVDEDGMRWEERMGEKREISDSRTHWEGRKALGKIKGAL